jgi:hypothetical protein
MIQKALSQGERVEFSSSIILSCENVLRSNEVEVDARPADDLFG